MSEIDPITLAVIEQLDTTIVIEPGCRAEADRAGNLIVAVDASSEEPDR